MEVRVSCNQDNRARVTVSSFCKALRSGRANYLFHAQEKRSEQSSAVDATQIRASRRGRHSLSSLPSPTGSLLNATVLVQLVEAGTGIGLQNAGEVARMLLRMQSIRLPRER
jgi:hypothetical protein